MIIDMLTTISSIPVKPVLRFKNNAVPAGTDSGGHFPFRFDMHLARGLA